MGLEKVISFAATVVLMAAATGNLDKLQMWVWKAQAKVIYESRSSNWGSPRFFPEQQFVRKQKAN